MRKSKEIRNSIVVADIFHHLFQKLQVRRVLPVFHPVSSHACKHRGKGEIVHAKILLAVELQIADVGEVDASF